MDPDAHLHIHTLGFVRLIFLNAPILSFLFPFLSEQDGGNKVASRANMERTAAIGCLLQCAEAAKPPLCVTTHMPLYFMAASS